MADNVIDTLSLEIVSEAQKAENGINRLITALGSLNSTLSRTNSQGMNSFSNAMGNLANAGGGSGNNTRQATRNLNSYTRSARQATRQTQSLARAFGTLYANYFLVIRGIKALGQNIEKSADYIEAYNYYNVAFGQVAEQWSKDFEKYGYENAEAYAESFTSRVNEVIAKTTGQQINVETGIIEGTGGKSLGLDIQQMTQYTSEVAAVTNSVGLTGEASVYASQALSMLAGDMSSLKNIDLSTVMNNFTSGLIGQSRALYKYGIDITNATLQTYAYELGLGKAVSEMSQSEKMQLRLIAILDQSEVAWGDLARTINSPSNMLRQFQANMSNLGRTIGSFFIPILERVLPVVNGLAIALQRLMVWFANLIGVQIDLSGFGQGYSSATGEVESLTGALENATKATDKLNRSTRKWDELNNITSKSNSGSGSGAVGGGIDLTNEIGNALAEFEVKWNKAFENMENKAEIFADKISNFFEPLKNFIENIINNAAFEYFGEVLSRLINNLKGVPNAIGIGLITFIQGLVNIGSVTIGGINIVLETLAFVLGLFDLDYNDIAVGLGALFTAIVTYKAISSIPDIVKGAATGFSAFFSAITGHPLIALAAGIAGIASAVAGFFALSDTAEEDALVVSEAVQTLVDAVNESISSIGTQYDDLEAQYGATREIADEYFRLTENFMTLNDEERELLRTYAQMLVDEVPEIADSIDTVTGAFIGQKEEVYKTIDSLEKYAKQLAMQEILKDLYKEQINLEIALKNNSIAYDEAKQHISEYVKEVLKNSEYMSETEKQHYLATADLTELYSIYSNAVKRNGDELKYTQEQINELVGNQKVLEASMGDAERAIKVATETIKDSAKESSEAHKTSSADIKKSISGIEDKMEQWASDSSRIGANAGSNTSKSYIENLKSLESDSATIMDVVKKTFELAGTDIGTLTGKNIADSMGQSIENNRSSLASKVASIFSGIKGSISMVGSMFGINIGGYAMGGFPTTGDLFFANEMGPELIGTIGGRTAVAPNGEITGIKDAIYSSMAQEMELMREQNQLLRGILNKEFGITENDIGKAARNYSISYKNRTGRLAYT